MATNTSNDKSRQISIRIPHDVLDEMEAAKFSGESTAGFLVTAARSEIARRQTEGNEEALLLSSLDALTRVEEIGVRAGEEIQQIITVARDELQRRTSIKSEPEN
ncbi:TPA: YlcI/YnfO family protein [Klebsiella michiganensis]|uniref:CopG family transcriptional regulator n=1 Tax=Klebsiella michiganensis TaxID=1134687 RepID=A0A2J5PWV2_9ENTR|nr:hypothetical protein CWN49_11910 [Klebsiella michiganensis]HBY4198609.1 hypothetical protein [Klebsiella pneumoniae]HCF8963470.1 hypothetical protein [Klebsiella pneumoniae]